MGCWNETDALTQLPILVGAPVKLLVLLGAYDEGGRICSCEDGMEVQFLPISGTYDEYGRIENIKQDWNTKAVLAYCNKKIAEDSWSLSGRGHQMKKYDENICTFSYKNIDNLLSAIERGYVAGKGFDGKWRIVTPIMIHDEIYNAALEMSGLPNDYLDTVTTSVNKTLKEIISTEGDLDGWTQRTRFSNAINRMAGKNMHGMYSSVLVENKDNDEIVKDCVARLVDFTRLFYFMERTRRCFMPQSGVGSGRADFKASADFFKVAYKFAQKMYKERGDS